MTTTGDNYSQYFRFFAMFKAPEPLTIVTTSYKKKKPDKNDAMLQKGDVYIV